jgi:hypothetical protein
MTIEQLKAAVRDGRSKEVEDYLKTTGGLSVISAQRNVWKLTQGEDLTETVEITRPLNPFEGQIFDDQELGVPVVFLSGIWKNFAGVAE